MKNLYGLPSVNAGAYYGTARCVDALEDKVEMLTNPQ